MNEYEIWTVRERDIDLMLMRALAENRDFRSWFFDRTGMPSDAVDGKVSVRHSVTHGNGEIDVVVEVERTESEDKTKQVILIEDKINAPLQPDQDNRYREHAEGLRNENTSCRTVLFAPDDYQQPCDFDFRVSYQDTKRWFDEHRPGRYESVVLGCAIDPNRRYIAKIDDQNTVFWREYYEATLSFRDRRGIDLAMPEPGEKPAGSTSIQFGPPLPAGVSLWHKFTNGIVDLEVRGAGARRAELERRLEPYRPAGWEVVEAGKSAAVRRNVERLNPTEIASKQSEQILRAHEAVADFIWWLQMPGVRAVLADFGQTR